MSLSCTCYRVLGKTKSRLLCDAFAAGCGGEITDKQRLLEGAAFFYGVTEPTLPVWKQARAEGRDWYFADNSYFDRTRQRFFRITKNAFQLNALAVPDRERLQSIGVEPKPWQDGAHVVVVEQSEPFMRLVGYRGNWLEDVCRELRKHTDRPLRVKPWRRDKDKAAVLLAADLVGAHALVTHMSAAANEALLAGVPVFTTGACAASPLASGPISDIERPRYPEGREEWAAGLAANQWTLEEIAEGVAWRTLKA